MNVHVVDFWRAHTQKDRQILLTHAHTEFIYVNVGGGGGGSVWNAVEPSLLDHFASEDAY